MIRKSLILAAALTIGATSAAWSASKTVYVRKLEADGKLGMKIGTVHFSDSAGGLVIRPNLWHLTPGPHGFHIHMNPSCRAKTKNGKLVPGLAAGGHYDPKKTGKHEGPEGTGHLGDLPKLIVGADGHAGTEMRAPRLTVAKIKRRALIIHAGGDNYSDDPKKLGGGGARYACAVIR